MGIQGSGKGTAANKVAEELGLETLESGAMVRALCQEDSELGRTVKAYSEAGKLAPDDVVIKMVEDFMSKQKPGQPILFDGFPRNLDQAEMLNDLLESLHQQFIIVLLELDEETALFRAENRRICSNKACRKPFPATYESDKCDEPECDGKLIRRKDDTSEAIAVRFEAFKKQTLPIIEAYEDKVLRVDANGTPEEVLAGIFEQLQPYFQQVSE